MRETYICGEKCIVDFFIRGTFLSDCFCRSVGVRESPLVFCKGYKLVSGAFAGTAVAL